MALKSSKANSPLLPNELDSAVLTHYVVTKNPVYKEKAYHIVENAPDEFKEPKLLYQAVQKSLFDVTDIPFPGPKEGKEKFKFIDLFAGIGGFRLALQNLGGLCVYSSEYDKFAQKTYFANFGETPFGDITKPITKSFIPKEFDILCGGFPCQPFSIAGVSKKNSLGRKHGFEDEKQGNLFFHVAEIIEKHRPKAFFLENVKNLVSHDKGNTFKVIKKTLLDLDYSFDHRVLNGKHFVPQHRDRTIMVGFDKRVYGEDMKFDFDLVKLPEANHPIKSILKDEVDPKFTLSDKLWNYLQEYAKKHKAKGNGFGFGLVNLEGISRTMSARYYKDGAEILIPQVGKNPRRLTPDESAALQGYPVNKGNKSFRIPVSDNQAYKQFGNSVVTPLIQAVGKEIVTLLQHE
ncbi:DNA (cytosine-5-)-methyltransferase [Mucilaginibacter rigui]|uniref:Cytosine-specific methyltransferase n=1 Tax=Mucilaginibacter rigui TaxID=534635 RepID=A0ABR7X3Q4_9SPHI|nr:DNA (cytosine-5-)-methyltransferase [Mucilaginibacter rigui]MBD1385141.1 DNA (cytosine-5-)-methyltransferase [Mucilaginibacter rigui]